MPSGYREADVRLGLFCSMFWRSVLGYAVSGVVLGGLYGCAFAGSILYFLSVPFGVAGVVLGWVAARGTRMRPLLGGVIGALAGLTLGGLPLAIAFGFALLLGGTLGAMYGLAAGLLCGIVIPTVTLARYWPLTDTGRYRRFVDGAGFLLGTVAILCLWVTAFFVRIPLLSDVVRDVGSQGSYQGFSWYSLLVVMLTIAIFAVVPSLVLGLAVQWRGGFVLDRYAQFSGPELGAAPEWRLERAVESALVLWFSDRRLRQSTPGVISICALVVAATVSMWKYQEKTTLHQNRHEQMPLPTYAQSSDIQLSPDGEWLAIRPYYDDFEIWSVGQARRMDTVPVGFSVIWALSPDGRLLAESCSENAPHSCGRVLRTEDGSKVVSLPNKGLSALSWSPDASMLAGAGRDEVWVWRTRDGALLQTLKGDSIGVQEPQFSPSARILATNGESAGDTVLWSLEDGRRIRTLHPPDGHGSGDYESYGAETAFSPDGTLFARAGGGGQVTLWSVATGEVLQIFGGGFAAPAFAFSPDGRLLAAANGTPGKITLWRVKDGARLRDYDCPGNPVSHLAFSADGERLVSYDYALRVWPIEEVDS